jgi:putative nucleotidyltransferase with HDIG domain
MKRRPGLRGVADRSRRSGPDAPPRARRLSVLRVLFAIAFTLAVVALLPPLRSRVEPAFHSGDVADRDVLAPFAFRVPLSGEEVRVARARASLAVLPVFERRRDVERDLTAGLAALLDSVAVSVYDRALDDEERGRRAAQWLPGVPRQTLRVALSPQGFSSLRGSVREFQRDLFARGLVDNAAILRRNDYREVVVIDGAGELRRQAEGLIDQGRLDQVVRAEAQTRFPDDRARAQVFFELVRGHALANLVFDVDETARRRDVAATSIKSHYDVTKNERIVGRNERVTDDQETVLRALEEERVARDPSRTPFALARAHAAEALRVALLCVLFAVYLQVFHPAIYGAASRLLAVLAVLTAYLIGLAAIARFGWSPYLAPVAFVSVTLAALFDFRLGLIAGAFAAALLAVATPAGVGPSFVGWIAGAAGVAGIERMRARSRGYSVFSFVAGAYALGILAVEAGGAVGWRELARHAMWGAVNGLFTGLATVFLLPVFEQLFNRASRFTLLELTDLNKPILKRLNMEAHGTYHHSMLLGNLVDAIATEVGADALRARVMAYYHDIGKIYKPEYFAENQEPGFNRHEKITPQMSALILMSHVKDGIELARQEKLPEVIVDGIREHHGTTVMAYFYQKALETDSHASVNRDDFRYPGPRPRTREAAILMCADTVEAAARSLKEPSPAHIRALVNRMVDLRAQEGELDDSGITLHDLGVIKERLITMLTTVHQRRVAYPGQDAVPPAPEDEKTTGETLAESG